MALIIPYFITSVLTYKPKTTIALTYLGNLMLQTQRLAKEEFLQSFDDSWPKIVRESIVFNEPAPELAPAAPESPGPTNPNSDYDLAAPDSHQLTNRKIM